MHRQEGASRRGAGLSPFVRVQPVRSFAGNVHSAHEWRQVLESILSEEQGVAPVDCQAYEYWQFTIVPIGDCLCRPPQRPVGPIDDFWYRAESWDHGRVVAKVLWHRGQLFPRVGFIVTNHGWPRRSGSVSTMDEGQPSSGSKRAVRPELDSAVVPSFVANRVRLSLCILAYNLGNFLRRLCLPKAVKHWSLRTMCNSN